MLAEPGGQGLYITKEAFGYSRKKDEIKPQSATIAIINKNFLCNDDNHIVWENHAWKTIAGA